MKRAPTFVIRSRYLSSIAWLSWQPANNCPRLSAHGSPGSLDSRASLSVGTAVSDASIFTKFKVAVDSKGLRLVPGSESLLVLM